MVGGTPESNGESVRPLLGLFQPLLFQREAFPAVPPDSAYPTSVKYGSLAIHLKFTFSVAFT